MKKSLYSCKQSIILMLQQFVDRNQELDFLEKKYLENSAQLIIIYGRRRYSKAQGWCF